MFGARGVFDVDTVLEKLIDQLNTSVFVLLVMLVAIGYVLMKVGEWKEKFAHHKDRIGNLEALSDKVVAMSTKVDLIYSHVNPNSMVRARSPITLTEVGIKTAAELNAETMLSKYYSRLKDEIEINKPQNAYDIQKFSMQVAKEKMIDMIDATEMNAIKDAAYNKGVLLEDIFSIFGVFLRDKILNEKGISVLEVDNHAPKA